MLRLFKNFWQLSRRLYNWFKKSFLVPKRCFFTRMENLRLFFLEDGKIYDFVSNISKAFKSRKEHM